MTPSAQSVTARFFAKVNKTETCWLWAACLNNNGYGRFYFNGRNITAQRAAFILFRGEIPNGFEIDHLCRVRHCVNPDHLETVNHRTNLLRGNTNTAARWHRTHCPRGHELEGDNITWIRDGRGRECRRCKNDRMKVYYWKMKEIRQQGER